MIYYFPTTNSYVVEKYYAIDIVDGKGLHYNSEWTFDQLVRHYGKPTTIKPEMPKGFVGGNLGLVLWLAMKEHGELPLHVREEEGDIFITVCREIDKSDFNNVMAILGYDVENARPFRFSKDGKWYRLRSCEFGVETKCEAVENIDSQPYIITESDETITIRNTSPKRSDGFVGALSDYGFRWVWLNDLYVAVKDGFFIFLSDGAAAIAVDDNECVKLTKIKVNCPENLRNTSFNVTYVNDGQSKAEKKKFEYYVEGLIATGQQYGKVKKTSDKEIAMALLRYLWNDIFLFFEAKEISFYEIAGEFYVNTKKTMVGLVFINKGGSSTWKRYFKYYAPESKKGLFHIFENFRLSITHEEFKQYNDYKANQ